MTPQERKVFELALEALESMQNAIYNIGGEHVEALSYAVKKANVAEQTITTIKEALAKPDQEPVGSLSVRYHRGCKSMTNTDFDYNGDLPEGDYELYTPPPPQRKPLTDEQDRAICEGSFNHESDAFFKENPLLDTDENRRIFYRGQRIIEDLEKKHKSYRSIEAAHGIKE